MNPNAERISREIEALNADRERQVSASIRQCIADIIAQQEIIKRATEEIAKHKAAMAQIKYEPINAADIVG